MTQTHKLPGSIRPLTPEDSQTLAAHLRRLESNARRRGFPKRTRSFLPAAGPHSFCKRLANRGAISRRFCRTSSPKPPPWRAWR